MKKEESTMRPVSAHLRHVLFAFVGATCALTTGVGQAAEPTTRQPVRPAPAPTPTAQHVSPQIKNLFLKGVNEVQVVGFQTSQTKGSLVIKGLGQCRFHADIFEIGKPNSPQHPNFQKVFDQPATLPVTLDNIGPLPPASYRAYLISYDEKLCPIQGPDKNAGGWYVDFKVAPAPSSGQSNNGQPNNGGGNPPPPNGGGGSLPTSKPATGKLSALSVPGGSFAEDDTQKLLVNGQGGCGFDLAISNKSYGGSYAQSYPVLPMKLDAGATLYNGTHFGTLAEGSYHADVTGKNGCTGTAGIDFKVTPKTSTKKILGKPTLGFDQQPKGAGGAFSVSKDSNIWFKVTVPQAIKDEQYASCCDVEFDYLNEFGGWEPLPNSPFNDSSYGLAVSQQAGVVNKSVSGFKEGTVWRMKVRAYKYKTEFEWSDWLQFKVDMN